MTVDLTKDELLLIHQAVKEYFFGLLSDQLNYDVDTSDDQNFWIVKYKVLDQVLLTI